MNSGRPEYQPDGQPENAIGGVQPGHGAYRSAGSSPSFSRPFRLSPRDTALISTIHRFRQASASQLLRLHFGDGSEASRGVRQRRACRRLVKWGAIQRLPRPIGGGIGGSAEYIYIPAGSRTRLPDPHTLDITQLYVELKETGITLLAFDPEMYAYVSIGQLELKPDAFVDLRGPSGRFRYFCEIDRGTEFRPQLNAKMRRYVQAFHYWTESTFPLVLFIVPDAARLRMVESVIKRQEAPGIFRVVQSHESLSVLGGDL